MLLCALRNPSTSQGNVHPTPADPWKVLVVDDEDDVRLITRMVFQGRLVDGCPIQLIDARSAAEARAILTADPGFAAALVDVCMETPEAGVGLVRWISTRPELENLRVVLRTGRPTGEDPSALPVHDYVEKTEMPAQRLRAVVAGAIRTSRDMARRGARAPAASAVDGLDDGDGVVPQAAEAFVDAVRVWLEGGPALDPDAWATSGFTGVGRALAEVALTCAADAVAAGADPETRTAALRGKMHHRYLDWADGVVRSAEGRTPAARSSRAGDLKNLMHLANGWPAMIGAPLQELQIHSEHGRHYAASLHLRETAEAFMRLVWLTFVYRAWETVLGARGLPSTAAEHEAVSFLETVATHSFSFGVALHTTAPGRIGALWQMGGTPTPPGDKATWRLMRALLSWRNHQAHGAVHDELRLAQEMEREVDHVVALLRTNDGWLRRVHAWLHARADSPHGCPSPILWRSPQGSLEVLERIVPEGLVVRDLARNLTHTRADVRLDAVIRMAAGRPVPSAPVPAEPDDVETPTALVLEINGALSEHRRTYVQGPCGAGKSVLLGALERALTRRGATVVRCSAPRELAISPRRLLAAVRRSLHEAVVAAAHVATLDLAFDDAPEAGSTGWWLALQRANPTARLTILVDEVHGRRASAAVLRWLHGLPFAAVAAGQAEVGATGWTVVRLDDHYVRAGSVVPGRWLHRHRKGIAPHHPRLLELANGRFATLRALADAAQLVGGLPAEDPRTFWSAALGQVERAVGEHPGAVRCIRRTLLTLAEARSGLSTHALRTLAASPGDEAPAWLDWLPLALNELTALVGEELAEPGGAAPETSAIHGFKTAWTHRIQIPSLESWLRHGRLPPGWEAERVEVRSVLQQHCRRLTMRPRSISERYAHVRALTHMPRLAERPEELALRIIDAVPGSDALEHEPAVWLTICLVRAQRARPFGRTAARRAALHYARALLAARRPAAARSVAETQLADSRRDDTSNHLRLVAARAAWDELQEDVALHHLKQMDAELTDALGVEAATLEATIRGALGDAEEAAHLARATVEAVGRAGDALPVHLQVRALSALGAAMEALGDPQGLAALSKAVDRARGASRSGRREDRAALADALAPLDRGLWHVEPQVAVNLIDDTVALRRSLLVGDARPARAVARQPRLARRYAAACVDAAAFAWRFGEVERARQQVDDAMQWLEALADPRHAHPARTPAGAHLDMSRALGVLARCLASNEDPAAIDAADAALGAWAQACGVSEVPAGGAFVEKGLAGAAHRELAALREEVLVRLGREREATPAGPAANLAELQLRALAVARATVSATPLTTLRRR